MRPTAGLRWFLAHLARWLAPYRRLTLLAAAALLIDVVYESAFPLALKLLIDRAIIPRDAAMLAGISAALVGLGLSAAAAAIFRDWLYARLSAAVIGDLRRAMYAHLQRLSMGYFRRTRAGDILACFSTDLAAVENAIVLALPMGLSSAASVILSALILFLLEWRMALLASIGLALSLLGSRLLAPAAQRAGDELKARQADLTAHVQESVQAQPLVKAFGLHKLLLLRFESGLSILAQTAIRANFLAYLLERIP
ncbi:MAG: ABC transporter ATP-binding protein, partial [Sulfuritalea sp.]|nr:ABC transporter ATP-binding protein [Sulfuritalea sp.]